MDMNDAVLIQSAAVAHTINNRMNVATSHIELSRSACLCPEGNTNVEGKSRSYK
ncbi:MAG: hypothetical protein Rpha_0493 [Candidatus Ruthia sp. Apha_13_S6]|nr:hypothetical protein [Candidatus Ruthia sp. Apha_13_S6]